MAGHPVERQHALGAKLDLLQQVRLAVRLMKQDLALGAVNGGLVDVGVKLLLRQRQGQRGDGNTPRRQVVVTGVVPAAPVEARNVLVVLVRRLVVPCA